MYSLKVATLLIALNFVATSSCQYLGQPHFYHSWKVMGTNKVPLQQKIFRFSDSGPIYQRMEMVQINKDKLMSGQLMVNQQLKQAPVEQLATLEQAKIKQQPSATPLSKRVGNTKPPTSIKVNRPNKTPNKHLKTLLPVGLTSWHLGGIRDLNGKHWHLPAEVMNRLAVNDVDLKVDRPAGSLGPSLIPR